MRSRVGSRLRSTWRNLPITKSAAGRSKAAFGRTCLLDAARLLFKMHMAKKSPKPATSPAVSNPATEGFIAKLRGIGTIKGIGHVTGVAAAVVALVLGVVWLSTRPSHDSKQDQKVGGDGANVGGNVGGNIDASRHSATTHVGTNIQDNNRGFAHRG